MRSHIIWPLLVSACTYTRCSALYYNNYNSIPLLFRGFSWMGIEIDTILMCTLGQDCRFSDDKTDLFSQFILVHFVLQTIIIYTQNKLVIQRMSPSWEAGSRIRPILDWCSTARSRSTWPSQMTTESWRPSIFPVRYLVRNVCSIPHTYTPTSLFLGRCRLYRDGISFKRHAHIFGSIDNIRFHDPGKSKSNHRWNWLNNIPASNAGLVYG